MSCHARVSHLLMSFLVINVTFKTKQEAQLATAEIARDADV